MMIVCSPHESVSQQHHCYTLTHVAYVLLYSSFTESHCVLPTGVPFPKHFIQACKKILTRLYRVFVHVYIHHFDKLVGIGAVSLLSIQISLTITLSLSLSFSPCPSCYRRHTSILATSTSITLSTSSN